MLRESPLPLDVQLELVELMAGVERIRCDLVTAERKMKDLSPMLAVPCAALHVAVDFIDGARQVCAEKTMQLNLPAGDAGEKLCS